MIIRPTTPQLLRDVRHELATVIEPEVQGPTARVTLEQIDIILEQCAVRSESEIAWMVEEIAEIESFADAVIAATGDERTTAALTAARSNGSGSLHLDALADDYNRTSEAFSCAIEACMARQDQADLLRQGIEMLTRQRADRETVIRANWRLVGRG
jgi:uncharacterized protein YgbK (DUF1537 family)